MLCGFEAFSLNANGESSVILQVAEGVDPLPALSPRCQISRRQSVAIVRFSRIDNIRIRILPHSLQVALIVEKESQFPIGFVPEENDVNFE